MPDEGEELEVNGRVSEILPNALFRVTLESEGRAEVVAHVAGGAFALTRVRPGDEVVVALLPYDTTRGRIVRRRGQVRGIES
jgi:translation initiation factor IF-1